MALTTLISMWTTVLLITDIFFHAPVRIAGFSISHSQVNNVNSKECSLKKNKRVKLFSTSENGEVDSETRRFFLSAFGASSAFLYGGQGSMGHAQILNEETKQNDSSFAKQAPGSSYNNNQQIIPFSSVRQQKLITLSNGLKVLLVNDSKSSQSTASLIIHGPGQFQDPDDLPGAAHLMEHMIMSYKITRTTRSSNELFDSNIISSWNKNKIANNNQKADGDLEDWLSENGGASNAFTAYDQTCFHINCQHDTFPRALEKFSSIFKESNVIQTCQDIEILKREIGRVDDELDMESVPAKIEMITKSFITNLEGNDKESSSINNNSLDSQHPYTKFSRGSLDSLQTIPELNGLNVSQKLIDFYKEFYVPTQAVLVVVSNSKAMSQQSQLSPLSTMESWVTKFNEALSRSSETQMFKRYHYPAKFDSIVSEKRVLLNEKGNNGVGDKVTIQWILNEDYRSNDGSNKAVEIAFVLNQIFGRRGTGSLYSILRKQDWIQNNNVLPPQVSIPINVSGFQLLKLELSLTPLGLQNQSEVVAAVFDAINEITDQGSFGISESTLAQYANSAKLYGYLLTPRPPDAVELAVDSMSYGVEMVNTRKWYRFPTPDSAQQGFGLGSLQQTMKSSLKVLGDPKNALIVTSSDNLSSISRKNINGVRPFTTLLPMSVLLYYDDRMKGITELGDQASLLPNNEFVPEFLPSPRTLSTSILATTMTNRKKFNMDLKESRRGWSVLEPNNQTPKMSLPRCPPEPNIRCVFVLQLLSSKPARATAEQAAFGELWRQSFEESISELSEQGALGGLAYELRFNQWGLRVSFLGISQSIQVYAKRLFEKLIDHHIALANGEYSINQGTSRATSIFEAKKARGLTPIRRNTIIQTLQRASTIDTAQEGLKFLQSCSGAVCFSQGDLTYSETEDLLYDMQEIFDASIERNSIKGQVLKSALPSIEDLVDTPTWKPRNASPCYLSGISLMSDACGRVLR